MHTCQANSDYATRRHVELRWAVMPGHRHQFCTCIWCAWDGEYTTAPSPDGGATPVRAVRAASVEEAAGAIPGDACARPRAPHTHAWTFEHAWYSNIVCRSTMCLLLSSTLRFRLRSSTC